jgi:hypothetical protein
MLWYILIGAAAVVALLAIVIARQPADFRIARKAKIAARPQRVFPQVDDFHNWVSWSPWEKYDPAMKRTYEGARAGVGAVYAWIGNKKVGEGRATNIESRPNELIRFKLEFLKPFTATNEAQFSFRSEGDGTVIEWAMTGKRNFMFKAMCLVMNMDKMCGDQFDQGLANLKSIVESQSAQSGAQERASLAATR